MSNSKSILFVLESFFPTHRAGTEVYVLNLCIYFKREGWEVGVLIATSNNQQDYYYKDIPIYTFAIPDQPEAKELNGLIPPRGIDSFKARLASINPKIVHFHSFGRAINGFHLQIAKKLKMTTVFTPHLGSLFCVKGDLRLFGEQNCDGEVIESRCIKCVLHTKFENENIKSAISELIKSITKMDGLSKVLPASTYQFKHRKRELSRIDHYADLTFSIAPWIQSAFKLNGISKAKLIPQGISPIFFDETLIHRHNIDCSSLHFAFIGRMHPNKGFHLLRNAWVESDRFNHKLHVITNPSKGEEQYYDDHKSWAENNSSVIWNEALDQKELAQYLNVIDVLILPSTSNEVAPLVILEAATRKIPVIGSDYIAIKAMVKDGINGWLFKNGNYKGLAKVIDDICDDPSLVQSFSDRIGQPHSMFEVAAIIEKHYNNLIILSE